MQCKSFSQAKATFIVYLSQLKGGMQILIFHNACQRLQNVNTDITE